MPRSLQWIRIRLGSDVLTPQGSSLASHGIDGMGLGDSCGVSTKRVMISLHGSIYYKRNALWHESGRSGSIDNGRCGFWEPTSKAVDDIPHFCICCILVNGHM